MGLVVVAGGHGDARPTGATGRARGVQGANTWDKLKDSLLADLKTGVITEETLLTYLREAEEYGKQHVFLFKRAVQGSPIPTQQHIKVWLQEQGAEDVLDKPRILELPSKPQVVEVRRDPFDPGEVLVFKIVETKTYDRYLGMTAADVVVTGMGATTPLGGDVASTWDGLLQGRSGISTLDVDFVAK